MLRAEVGAGQQVGRFTLRAPLGEGGMGQVWRARDPELERDVAVKVLRPEVASSAARADLARARLRREAQAMARLAHPNVLPIYEVGEADAQVFLVMELVDGGTLTRWLAERPRSPDAIVAAFIEAGRGLAAAHDAGLVHRDFKPDNVLVGADRRIRVTDFGLVGHGEATTDVDPATSTDDVRTRTGAILGTPAYAAPEVLARQPVTARSDQFSFAVALYEALYGQPPFAGDTVADLYTAVTTGAIRVPPSGDVPAPVRDAILRALATDPAARWPSMAALLVALAAPPRRRWRTPVALAVAAVAVAGGATAVALRSSSSKGSSAREVIAPPPALAAPIQLTSTGGCTESPIVRGDQIVYALTAGREHTYLYKVPLAGGAPVRLSDQLLSLPVAGSRPDRVLAVRPDDRLVEVDLTGAITDLPSPPALAAPVGFGWDGETLVYTRPDRAQLRTIAGGVERALVDLPTGWVATSIEVSPDRRWLLIGTGGHAGACAVDLRATAPAPRCVELPGSSGSLMIVSSDEYLVTGSDGTWRRRFDDTAPAALLSPSQIDGVSMTLTGDGHAVVASRCMRWARLLALSPANGAARLLTDGRFLGPTARADGTLALPRFVNTDDTTLSVRDPDGTFRDLTPPDQIVRDPGWDTAGKRLAYQAAQPEGGGIHVIDLTPFAPRRLTTERTDRAPVFLADGRVAFARVTRPGQSQLFLADPETGVVGPATHPDRWPYDRHPDGRLLVGDPVRHRLWLWDPTTDRDTVVSSSDDYAPDSAHVTVDGKDVLGVWKNELWRLPVAGGEATLLYTAANGATVLDGATTLRDGTVVVVERIYRGDLYVSRLPPGEGQP